MRIVLAALALLACRPDPEPAGLLYADPGRIDLAAARLGPEGFASTVVIANVGTECIAIETLDVEGENADLLGISGPAPPLVLEPSAVLHLDVLPRVLPIPAGLADVDIVISGLVGERVEGACLVLAADTPKPVEIRVSVVLATPAGCDADLDTFLLGDCGGEDCDDDDATVFPGAVETCNGKDDDCDTVVDGPLAVGTIDWFLDDDGDGYGDAATTVRDCDPPVSYVADDTDCDDLDPGIYPAAPEECDGLDQDCDLEIDEGFPRFDFHADADGDGHGDPGESIRACVAPPGTVPNDIDCDDADASIHPGAAEHCDNVDEDCDGTPDDNAVDDAGWWLDNDGDSFGNRLIFVIECVKPPGYAGNPLDCNDNDPTIKPNGIEVCDGIDQDCDTVPDDNPIDGDPWFPDVDGDTYGDDAAEVSSCVPVTGYIQDGGDCDDTDGAINPDATETCDAVDQDCDGLIDQGPGVCACPIEHFGDHAYGFCNVTLTWTIANIACSLSGYELVKIDDAAEDTFVEATSQSYNASAWWTGYSDGATEGTWVWTDGSTGTYTAWASGSPATGNNSTDCMQIGAPTGWIDASCGTFDFRRFVCEAGP